jgi:hypothetical protein
MMSYSLIRLPKWSRRILPQDSGHEWVIAVLRPQFPVILHDSLQREFQKTYAPPTTVTWLQLLRKQTNTGTPNTLTADTYWSARTRLRTFPHFWHQARLANATCAWSWRLSRNNFVIHPSRHRHRLWFLWSPVRLHSIEIYPTAIFNPRIINMGLVPPWHQSGYKTGAIQNLTTLPVRHTLRVSPVPHTTHKNSSSYAPPSRHAASTGSSRFGSHTTASRYSQWADILVTTPIYYRYKNPFRFFTQKITEVTHHNIHLLPS